MVRMSEASVLTSVIKSTPQLARMSLSLFWMYATIGRRVRKARKAFEEQLVLQGMTKENAEQLSMCFEELKNSAIGMMKQGMAQRIGNR